LRAVQNGRLATTRGWTSTADDRRRRAIIANVMCNLRINLGELGDDFAHELSGLEPFIAQGLLYEEGCELVVAEAARPLVRNIAAVFDTYGARRVAEISRGV
jgi:oxygen-independent coproporphyrinogen-3 oxidase